MGVVYNGQTTSFSGDGAVNPNKLVIPQKNALDPATRAGMLAIEQWCNNLTSSGFGQISHTYAVSGTLVVPSGATGYLPPFFMPAQTNQGTSLFGVVTEVRAGSCVLSIEHNGNTIATGVTAGTSKSFTAVSASVANEDSFQPVITSVSSADGLSCSFFFAVSS
jgi:hypothetical protein